MKGDLTNQGQFLEDPTSFHKEETQWSSKKQLFNDFWAQITMASRHKQLQRRTDLEHSQVSKLDQGELSGKLTKCNGGHDALIIFYNHISFCF